MAKTREIRNRIRSVSNTMKITRTMEMVATVKAKQCQDRLQGALPYQQALGSIVGRLTGALDGSDHPLFARRPKVRRIVLLAVSSNRGFCGGFNANVLQAARDETASLRRQGVEVELHLSGKKAVSFFRFLGWDADRTFTGFDDRVTYADVEPLGSSYIRRFEEGDIDEVRVMSYRFLSVTNQQLRTTRLLPFEPPPREEEGASPDRGAFFEFDPGPGELLEAVVPFAVRNALFTLLLEAAASENIARRMAMKLATDNATEMIKELRGRYNRARQDQITTELLDIMGGAAAIGG